MKWIVVSHRVEDEFEVEIARFLVRPDADSFCNLLQNKTERYKYFIIEKD